MGIWKIYDFLCTHIYTSHFTIYTLIKFTLNSDPPPTNGRLVLLVLLIMSNIDIFDIMHILDIAYCLSSIAYRLLPIAYCLPPVAYRLSPIAHLFPVHFLLSIGYRLLPFAYCLFIGYRLIPPPAPTPLTTCRRDRKSVYRL